jgi:cell division inhibitor SepF
MTMKSKIKTFFMLEDEFEDNEAVKEPVELVKPKKTPVKPQNVVNLQTVQKVSNTNKPSKVVLVEPHSTSEATEIADHIKNRRAVVVNLQRIDSESGRQIVDFLGGVVYALNGEISKIGTSTFLCTPDNVEISGNISDMFPEREQLNTRW